MNLQQGIKKLRRLLSLHEQELEVIKAELASVEHRYVLATQHVEKCELEIITTLQQFSEGLQTLYGQIGTSVMIQLGQEKNIAIGEHLQLAQEREQVRSALSEKHRSIQSLNRYLEQKQLEFETELARQENLEMTDRYLGKIYNQGEGK